MREFALDLGEELLVGLRPDERIERRQFALVEAMNLRVSEYGLETLDRLDDPFDGGVAIDFPWPQIFHLKDRTLLFGKTSLREVNTSDWTLQTLNLYDISGNGDSSIPAGGVWHVAEGHDSWLAFNGAVTLWTDGISQIELSTVLASVAAPTVISPRTGASVTSPRGGTMVSPRDVATSGAPASSVEVSVQEAVYKSANAIQSGCFFRGRFLCGGFGSSPWSDTIEEIFDAWIRTNGTASAYDDLGSRWVMWSSIGGGDFPHWLLRPEAYSGGTGATSALFLEKAKENSFGFMPMSWKGPVMRMAPLGDAVVVYGGEGVSILTPFNSNITSGFGEQSLRVPGVLSRGAVGVAPNRHIWVDWTGSLWIMGADRSPRRLGYEHYLQDFLSASNVLITYDEKEDFFVLSGGPTSFILAGTSLTEVDKKVTTSFYFNGTNYGLESYGLDRTARIVTTPLELGERTIKTITGVWLSVTGDADMYVAIDYRYNKAKQFERSHWVRVNKEGDAAIRVAGVDFRIVVASADDLRFNLDGIRVKWQASDRRFVRGPSISAVAAGAG